MMFRKQGSEALGISGEHSAEAGFGDVAGEDVAVAVAAEAGDGFGADELDGGIGAAAHEAHGDIGVVESHVEVGMKRDDEHRTAIFCSLFLVAALHTADEAIEVPGAHAQARQDQQTDLEVFT